MAEMTRGELVDLVSKQVTENEKYREAILKDPKGVIGMQLGRELPDWLNIEVVQETADKMVVVLPHVPQEGDELADADLEAVAGGKSDDSSSDSSGSSTSYTCNDAAGMATRIDITTNADFGFF